MDLSRYVGIPWADKGRSPDACDCWGLCCTVYRDLLGIELPSYDDRYANAADREVVSRLISGGMGIWREVQASDVRMLDGVLMTEAGVPRHMGLVVRPGFLLHMVPYRESVIEPYDSGKIRHRVTGFFRHESRA